MTPNETVTPALTDAEWESGGWWRNGRLDLLAVIATVNDELPDDEPRKITHAMAIAMTQAAHFLENADGHLSTHWPADGNPWHVLATDLRRYAAVIRSLLPPDPRTREA